MVKDKILSKRQEAKLLNRVKYFTGIPCKHGHISERLTSNGVCLTCVSVTRKEKDAKYREKNLEKIRVYDRNRPARAKNPKLVKAAKKRFYAKHKETILSTHKEYRAINADRISLYFKEYKATNKAKVNAVNAKRRAAKLQRTPAWLTKIDYERISSEYKLAELLTKLTCETWHVDHRIPLQGKNVSGLHVPSNLRVIRGIDNSIKTNKYEIQ